MKIDIKDKTIKDLLQIERSRDQMYYDNALRGFAIRISKKGFVSFVLAYVANRKEQRLTLGAYKGAGGAMTVQEARRKAEELRRQVDGVKNGDATAVDPAMRKVESAREMLYGDLAQRFIDEHAAYKRSGGEDIRRLNKYILPKWKNRKVKELTRADVDALLSPIKKVTPYEANRLLALVSVVFSFALDKGIIDVHPALRMKSLKTKENPRQRALTTSKEFRIFWRMTSGEGPWSRYFDQHQGQFLRMLLLTGARRSEIANMEWKEIHFGERTWTLPASRSKNGNALTLPLTNDMLDILEPLWRAREELPEAFRLPFVFTGRYSAINAHKLGHRLVKIRRYLAMLGMEGFSMHDLRRSCETGMAASRVPKEYRDRVLNHVDNSVGGRNYNKWDYLDEKKEALEKWSNRIRTLLTDNPVSNVIPFREAV